jgi:transcriptional regulator with XRE-family HTH domain
VTVDSSRSGPVTLAHVAAAAGVDRSTVSRALHGDVRRVSAATIAHVTAVADELGYRPHQAAATLRSGHSRMLGVLVPTITDAAMAALFAGIEEEAHKAGYLAVVTSTGSNDEVRRAAIPGRRAPTRAADQRQHQCPRARPMWRRYVDRDAGGRTAHRVPASSSTRRPSFLAGSRRRHPASARTDLGMIHRRRGDRIRYGAGPPQRRLAHLTPPRRVGSQASSRLRMIAGEYMQRAWPMARLAM